MYLLICFGPLRCVNLNLYCEICIQLNLSTTLVTEEIGGCRKVAIVERWPIVKVTPNTGYIQNSVNIKEMYNVSE